jgi:hypothetical protein
MFWVGDGYYGAGSNENQVDSEMKIQAYVHQDKVFIFIRESQYPPMVYNPSESGINLSREQAKEFAEHLLQEMADSE